MNGMSESTAMTRCRARLLTIVLAGLMTVAGFVNQGEAQPQPGSAFVDTEGTQVTVTLPDGRVLRSPDLVGAVLSPSSGLRVRIDAVEQAPGSRKAPLWLHTFFVERSDGSWANLCGAGPDGRRVGFPVPGCAAADGAVAEAGPGVFELTCTGGAQAKCVRLGYRPWATAPGGQPLRSLYNACTG
jgi:hypothetical protein